MENIGFDQEIAGLLESAYQAALLIGGQVYTSDQIKLMIIATNLESLANTFLMADNDPEGMTLNLKQVALGLFGSSDWLKTDLDPEVIP